MKFFLFKPTLTNHPSPATPDHAMSQSESSKSDLLRRREEVLGKFKEQFLAKNIAAAEAECENAIASAACDHAEAVAAAHAIHKAALKRAEVIKNEKLKTY